MLSGVFVEPVVGMPVDAGAFVELVFGISVDVGAFAEPAVLVVSEGVGVLTV